MKIKSKFFICFMSFVLLVSLYFFSKPLHIYAYTVSSSEIVMERKSGRVLFETDADKRLAPASTTKILTAYTVLLNYDTEKIVTVPKECAGVEGSSVYLRAGDRYSVIDLLYGLMLRSGNDCAETLAVCLAGSVENFAAKMNETAIACGASDSHFANPHGLPDDDHYTTARDLCLITRAAMSDDIFRKIVSSESYEVKPYEGQAAVWKNKNKMLRIYGGANGVKTGYTVKAGRCLVSSALRDGMEVICVVLNSPQMFERSCELLDRSFDNFDLVKIIDKDKFGYVLPTDGYSDFIRISVRESVYYPVGKGEKISCRVTLPDFLPKGVKNGENVGLIEIFSQKQLLFSEKIYTL